MKANLTQALNNNKGKQIIIQGTNGKNITDIEKVIRAFGKKFTDSIQVTNEKQIKDVVILTVTI